MNESLDANSLKAILTNVMRNMTGFITISLLVSWYVFSGTDEKFHILCGICSAGLTLWILNKGKLLDSRNFPTPKPKYLYFMLYLIKEIAKSSVEVARITWKKNPAISPVSGYIECDFQNNFKRVLYSIFITLTPGTVCTELYPDKMQVYCLTKEGFEELKENRILRRIRDL